MAASAGESHSAGDKVIYRWQRIKAFLFCREMSSGVLIGRGGVNGGFEGIGIVIFPALLLS